MVQSVDSDFTDHGIILSLFLCYSILHSLVCVCVCVFVCVCVCVCVQEMAGVTAHAAFPLTPKHIMDVERELGPFAKWRKLGLHLGLPPESLQNIDVEYRLTNDRLVAVLREWLKGNYDVDEYGLPSWGRLAEAVKPIDQSLYCAIKERHPSSVQSELPKAKVRC